MSDFSLFTGATMWLVLAILPMIALLMWWLRPEPTLSESIQRARR